MNSKRIAVVTGANGFVGSHLVDLLLSKNYSVRCIVRKTSNLKWLKDKDVEIIDCGLFNKDALKDALKSAELVYHVAGVVKAKSPEGYFKGNVDTTHNLISAALENKETIKRFLIVSSGTAAGPSLVDNPVNEDIDCKPITTYGRSKLAQEELTRSYADRLPVTIIRAAAIYGERDTEILIFFKTYSKGLMTTIGFNRKILSLLHVTDLVNGIYQASVSEKAIGKTYFIGSEKFYTWEEVGDATAKAIGKKAFHVKVPHFAVYGIAAVAQFFAAFSSKPATLNIEKAKDITQAAWIFDITKAVNDFGYKQNISLEEGIKRTIDWYKEMKWL